MNRSREHAESLLKKAREDAWMMRSLSGDPESPDWGVGFHAQQAVEKAIKAVIAARGAEYPYSHDILTLLNVLEAQELPFPPDAADLPELTPYGAVLRYDQDVDLPCAVDREALRQWVESTLQWARSQI